MSDISITRHIDLYRSDPAYRALSDNENRWGNEIDAIHDGARGSVSLYTADRNERAARADRLAYLAGNGYIVTAAGFVKVAPAVSL